MRLISGDDGNVLGERKILSRGFVRNVLIPRQQALVVVRGKIASPLRDMMIRERRVASLVNLSKVQVAPEKVEIENKIKTVRPFVHSWTLTRADTLCMCMCMCACRRRR